MRIDQSNSMATAALDHRAWDTQHFGFRVASIRQPDLDPQTVESLLAQAQEQGYQLVYWASSREYPETWPLLVKYQGLLADRKTTYGKRLGALSTPLESAPYELIEWDPRQQSPELLELGVAAGLWSRFGADPRIARDKFRSLYEIWMQRSIARELADTVLVVRERDSVVPLGMVTISLKQGVGQIGLISVSKHQRGRGLGRLLIEAADRWMSEHGAHSAQVITQQHNKAACGLYEQAGYQIERLEYYYHFWVPVLALSKCALVSAAC